MVHDTGAKTLAVGRLVAEDQLADLQVVLDAPAWDNSGMKVQDTLIPGILDTGRYEEPPGRPGLSPRHAFP